MLGKKTSFDLPPEFSEPTQKAASPQPSLPEGKYLSLKYLNPLSFWLKLLKLLKIPQFLKFSQQPPPDPKAEQRQKLREIGSYCQQIRQERGISLETIAAKTLIPLRLLKAIEEGDLEALPEAIYIRGFIKQFADFLDLNGSELALAFPLESQLVPPPSRWTLRLPVFQVRPIHLYFLYIFLVFLTVQAISNLLKQQIREMNRLETLTQPSVQAPPPTPALPKPSPSPPATAKKVQEKSVVIDVQIKEECWLRVVADGKNVFEGILPKGTRRQWEARQKLTLKTGNAGGIWVAFNDQKAKQLGKPGQIAEVTYQGD